MIRYTESLDLRSDYDEQAIILNGILYRKENAIQVWWNNSGKETWIVYSEKEAERNFSELLDRWR